MTEEENTLRRLLWLRHGCSVTMLYGDDGEMQCAGGCGVLDFKNTPINLIEQCFQVMGHKRAQQVIATKEEKPLDGWKYMEHFKATGSIIIMFRAPGEVNSRGAVTAQDMKELEVWRKLLKNAGMVEDV